MKNFIYVFTEKDRDKLKKHGLSLLKEDTQNSVYIFVTQTSSELSFDLLDEEIDRYCLSDTLTF